VPVNRLTVSLGILAGLIAVLLVMLVYEGAWTEVYQTEGGQQIWRNRLTGKRLRRHPQWSRHCYAKGGASVPTPSLTDRCRVQRGNLIDAIALKR
jgi:hypothetical protein